MVEMFISTSAGGTGTSCLTRPPGAREWARGLGIFGDVWRAGDRADREDGGAICT